MFDPPTSYDVIQGHSNLEAFHKYPEDYVVRPPYQRKSVWSRKKKQALLDSLFRRYYVPKIVLRKIKLGMNNTKNEVIDGQQRIRVAQEFYEGELSLPQTLADLDSSLPGRKYGELSVEVRKFVDKTLRYDTDTVKGIGDPRNPDHQRTAAEIFWRLQQGETLNYMEIAHARLSSLPRNFVVKYADDSAPRRRNGGRKPSVQPCCTRDEGRPLGAAVQAEASNHPPLLRLRGVVVSRWEKARQ